jgi:transposase
MEKHSTEFVGLDVHKESTAIGRASAGRTAGRFVGTVGPTLAELLKSLKSLGRPEELSIVYEAGPCGYGLVRELRWNRFEWRGQSVGRGYSRRKPSDWRPNTAISPWQPSCVGYSPHHSKRFQSTGNS